MLYPLTQDEFPLEAIDFNGNPIDRMEAFSSGTAGTVRYSNIAQLEESDCIMLCNKEVMEALGQREVLRFLYEAEDQSDAAGSIVTAAAAKLPGVPLQCMLAFVEQIIPARQGDSTWRFRQGYPNDFVGSAYTISSGLRF